MQLSISDPTITGPENETKTMIRNTKWVAIIVVAMMLLAMFAYVASDDEVFPVPAPTVEQSAE